MERSTQPRDSEQKWLGQCRAGYGIVAATRSPRGRLSNSSSILSDIFRHPDVQEDTLRRKIKNLTTNTSPRIFADFLRNTQPPSAADNHDSTSEEDKDWWRKSLKKVFGKKKKKKKKRLSKQISPAKTELGRAAI